MSFEGYEKIEFQVNGRYSIIVCPKKPLNGNPWIWKTEFFEAFNFAERALLDMGFHLAYHQVSDMYGCPESISMMKEFYDVAVGTYGLNSKPALFGFSRGGLYACNFALKYPENTAMIYLDAPVLDVRSWPGGKYSGLGAPECWEECKALYGITEKNYRDFANNPLDNAEKLAETGLPILLVCGAVDRYVPYFENGYPFFKRVKAAGGRIARVIKPYCDHHPHGLYDTNAVCNFVMSAYGLKGEEGFSPDEISYNNAKAVAYGDSITRGTYTAIGDTCPASVVDKRWVDHVCDRLGLTLINNYAENGISVSSTSTVRSEDALSLQYVRMDDSADLVFIAIGTNDFGTDVKLGQLSDREDVSFYGGLDVLCRGLKAKYDKAGIVFVTPVKRRDENRNNLGHSLNEYGTAIKEVAHYRYGFKVVNGSDVPIELENEEFMKAHLLDGVHLDSVAHEMYGEFVTQELLKGEGLL